MQNQTPNKELMARARKALTGKWGILIGMLVVYFLIVLVLEIPFYIADYVQEMSIIAFVGLILMILIIPSLMLSFTMIYLAVVRNKQIKFSDLFEGFNHFGAALKTYLLMSVFIILWALLLYIPAIIKSFSYAMTFYILADDKSTAGTKAITLSRKMMDGNKAKLFCLYLRFIGWYFLGMLSLGIGFLWIAPYMATSVAEFYEDVKKGNKSISE